MDVLVVDDDLVNLKIVCKYIKELNVNVHQATNGQEAWDVVNNPANKIDIVLTDRMMPIMDGIELTKKIKANDKFKRIPVIMLTAALEAQQVIEGNEAGVYYYITKPFEKEILLSIMSTAMDEVRQNG